MYIHKLTSIEGILLGELNLVFSHNEIKSRQHNYKLRGIIEADHSHIFWKCTKINIYMEKMLRQLLKIFFEV